MLPGFPQVTGLRVVVAVSGGPDSVCLLHVLREIGVNVVGVAHVNHKQRGEASEEDQRFVESLAASLNLEFALRRGEAPWSAQRDRNREGVRSQCSARCALSP